MLIKRKSLIVALISSFVIALVLVLTLFGYLVYIELKGEGVRRSYHGALRKIKAAQAVPAYHPRTKANFL